MNVVKFVTMKYKSIRNFFFQLGQEFSAVSTYYEKEFFQEMSSLNNLQPTLTCRVSNNIPEIIQFIQTIINKGHAYKSDDGNYIVKFFFCGTVGI